MIPKFDVYHWGLHSSYLSFDRYKIYLQNQAFSGYIKIEDSQTQCFVFIKGGKEIASFLVSGHTFKDFNPSELQSLFKHQFFVSSYTTPQQGVDFFARCHTAKSIYDNLSFDSVDFDKFFTQIESKKITGFLEASKIDDPNKKYIYFYGGKIFGYMNIKGKEGVFEKNLDKAQVQMALKNSIVAVYVIPLASGSSTTQKHRSSKTDTLNQNEISSIDMVSNENRNSVLKCYEEIFQMFEKTTPPDEFTAIWRMSALDLSNKYLFLNPFAGEFNYENSKIDLWDQIDIKIAIDAMDELSNSIAKKVNLPQDGIKAIKNNYLNILVACQRPPTLKGRGL